MKRLSCLALPLLPAFMLSGCLQGSDAFPSLAKRPYEIDQQPAADDEAPSQAPPSAITTPLAYEQRQAVSTALDKHRAADTAFRAALPDTRSAVSGASGAAVASEAWVVAQSALSRLEVTRSPSVEALAELDTLLTERLSQEQQGAAYGGVDSIREAREVVVNAVAEQSAVVADLAGRLR